MLSKEICKRCWSSFDKERMAYGRWDEHDDTLWDRDKTVVCFCTPIERDKISVTELPPPECRHRFEQGISFGLSVNIDKKE